MQPTLILGCWIGLPLIVYSVNMSLTRRFPSVILFFPVVALLCVPGCYQTYSIGVHNEAYRAKMDKLVQRLDLDGDGQVLDAEVTPEFAEAMTTDSPIKCVIPLEFVYIPASFMWCAVCFTAMYAMESAIARPASKHYID